MLPKKRSNYITLRNMAKWDQESCYIFVYNKNRNINVCCLIFIFIVTHFLLSGLIEYQKTCHQPKNEVNFLYPLRSVHKLFCQVSPVLFKSLSAIRDLKKPTPHLSKRVNKDNFIWRGNLNYSQQVNLIAWKTRSVEWAKRKKLILQLVLARELDGQLPVVHVFFKILANVFAILSWNIVQAGFKPFLKYIRDWKGWRAMIITQ